MSEEEKSGSATTQPEGSQEEKDFVPVKAYEEVTRDMHKFKKEREQLTAEANELRAQLKAQEEAKMLENEQYKELLTVRERELEEVKQTSQQQSSRFQRAVKRTALKQELGGKIKDEYLSFADLDQISMNEDGIVDSESLRNVANEFRKQHGQLIPQDQEKEITGHASNVNEVSSNIDVSKMSGRELLEHYKQLKKLN